MDCWKNKLYKFGTFLGQIGLLLVLEYKSQQEGKVSTICPSLVKNDFFEEKGERKKNECVRDYISYYSPF